MKNKGFVLKIAQVVLEHPPISSRKEIVYEDKDYRIVIREPVSAFAWKLLLSVLALGRKVGEDENVVAYEILKDSLYGAIRTANIFMVKRAINELMQCLYEVEEKKEKSTYFLKFLADKPTDQDSKLIFRVSKSFVEGDSLRFYFAFSYTLRSPSALNLHAFLSANTRLRNAKESTLLQRARITANYLPMARKYLTSALDELVSIGFLKGYRIEKQEGERVYVLDRLDTLTLKAKAQEWFKRLNRRIEEFKERRRESMRESMRRLRARKRGKLIDTL